MTDEPGVEERYQPTERNMVRLLPQSRSRFAYPNDAFLSGTRDLGPLSGSKGRGPPFLLL